MNAEASAMDMGQPRHTRKKAIAGAAILAFLVIATCAGLLCFTYSEYETQAMLNKQRDIQQTMLDKTLDAIRAWRVELVNQARFISSSEMFRIFITDTSGLSREQMRHLTEPEALHSEDENTRALAEQRSYMTDLLADFVRRRAWSSARIVSVEGDDIVAQSPAPLGATQREIITRAVKDKSAVFGPVHQHEGQLYMEMADPLFEVLGIDEPKCVAVLLLSVPMATPLKTFLTNSSGQEDVVYPRIVDQASGSTKLIMLSGNHLAIRPLEQHVSDSNLPFALRAGLASARAARQLDQTSSAAEADDWGENEVYSLGAQCSPLDWLFVLETPASVINARILARKWEIYGLGALATIGLTLLAAFIFAQMTSRQHKARAAQLDKLYTTIRQQKLVLDGVNKSLEAGLLLVDDKGFIKMANPAFGELAGTREKELAGLPLMDALPAKAGVELMGDMRNVIEERQSRTIELSLPGENGDRLYRVMLFPYQSEAGETTSSGSGCVATFKDITVFRANAKKAAQRQEALLTAMDRAIESADPNLVGQSAKMATVSEMLADSLGMDATQKETLRIASLLSQIGKLFVPRELLHKKGTLTPDEKREVARAPEHADRILRDLHFDLPVRETVLEMGERLDGSGPAGMKGADISMAGRTLAIVNALIAMTSPRAWRTKSGMPVEEALEILSGDARFDMSIVQALERLDMELLKSIIRGS